MNEAMESEHRRMVETLYRFAQADSKRMCRPPLVNRDVALLCTAMTANGIDKAGEEEGGEFVRTMALLLSAVSEPRKWGLEEHLEEMQRIMRGQFTKPGVSDVIPLEVEQ